MRQKFLPFIVGVWRFNLLSYENNYAFEIMRVLFFRAGRCFPVVDFLGNPGLPSNRNRKPRLFKKNKIKFTVLN